MTDNQQITAIRRRVGLDTRAATAGDASGTVYEPGRPGYVRVTYPASAGRTFPTVVRLRINIDLKPGTPVVVGYDRNLQPAIVDIDFTGMEAGTWNPYTGGTVNPDINPVDLNLSPILLSTAFGAAQPLYVTLFPFMYIRHRTIHLFTGVSGGINLTSYIPGTSNYWLLAGIFLKTDDTHEIAVSTAQDRNDPLDETDIQECITASSSGAVPICMWILRNGQTAIADTDKFWDARQWINISEDASATVTTADATVTTIASITIAELQMATITATMNGRKSDYSAAIGGTLNAVVRRATGGNVTLVGSVTTDIHEDSPGTPTFTLDIDTGTQTARFRVTGIAAESWVWTVNYKVAFS